MPHDLTIEAVRLALGLQDMQARVASTNIAQANVPGARASHVDFSAQQALLQHAAHTDDSGGALAARLAASDPRQAPVNWVDGPIRPDDQVADMVAAGTQYHALSEALSRQFGLMRLSITGRN